MNVRAEEEIEIILNHLEFQNDVLIAMVQKLGVSIEEVTAESHGQADKKAPMVSE